MRRILHFSIGPVQDFVARSRRTRDLLASSFLLSYLSGCAMLEVLRKKGTILLPYIGDPRKKGLEEGLKDELLKAIYLAQEGKTFDKKGPWVGSLPNRFSAEITKDFHPQECVEAVIKAWSRIASAVQKAAFKKGMSKETRKIWERQIPPQEEGFWEIQWIVEEINKGEKSNPGILNQRKHWRTHIPPPEPGDKCTLMSELQELSGISTSLHEAQKNREQKRFWLGLREELDFGKHDFTDNERLSAVGLIKRLYPRVAQEALGWDFPDKAIYFPSTAYLAAFPWIVKVVSDEKSKTLVENFARKAENANIRKLERGSQFFSMPENAPSSFINLEGGCFFEPNLYNPHFWTEREAKPEKQEELREAYKELTDEYGKPRPFYALLLMDGDSMGALLKELQRPELLSQALANFTGKVAKTVNRNNGVTVYAGGDDVLALLPIDSALKVAVELKQIYEKSFQDVVDDKKKVGKATISAAIVYAHYRAPLQGVLSHAHHLLDDIAKDKTGRNSLATSVWKTGGPVLTWSAPWDIVLMQGSDSTTNVDYLVQQMNREALSSSFLYTLRDRYERAKSFSDNVEENRLIFNQLAAAEYKRIVDAKSHSPLDIDSAKKEVELLIDLCLRSWWDENSNLHRAEGEFQLDGALLVRFLAQKEGKGNE